MLIVWAERSIYFRMRISLQIIVHVKNTLLYIDNNPEQ